VLVRRILHPVKRDEWQLPEEAFQWIATHVDPDSTIIELGSGEGSARVAKLCRKLVSFEHNERFLRARAANHVCLHAPIRNGWYAIPPGWLKRYEPYSLVIVDGPPKSVAKRSSLLKHVGMFSTKCVWLIDDTNRIDESQLSHDLVVTLRGREVTFGDPSRMFSVIVP
jgi:hypothetical protein